MNQMKKLAAMPLQEGGDPPTPAQVKKARMLVSLLGADFAKTSPHPFFKELAQTAVRPLDINTPPPDMSKTLAKLIRRLADAEKGREVTVKKIATEPEQTVEPPAQDTDVGIMTQHPALIAKHLIHLPTAQQLEALRKLRGPTARQVATYLGELKVVAKR